MELASSYDKVRAAQKKYRDKNKEYYKEYHKKWQAENKERVSQYQKEWRANKKQIDNDKNDVKID